MSFPMVAIGEVVEDVKSWNPAALPQPRPIRYIDLSAVDKDAKRVMNDLVVEVLSNEAPSRARQLVSADDVLVSTVRPNLNGVALLDASLDGATASTGYCVLRPSKSKLDPKYLRYWVESIPFVDEMTRLATGASYPAVSDAIIKASRIPLPPLPTQRRIAAVLDKAQALVANDRRTLAVYDQLAKSLFLEMFGDPVRNERGWEKKSMRDVVERISDGPFGSNLKSDHYADAGIRVIRLSNVGVGVFIDEDKAYVREDHFEKIRKYSCGPGDVLVATMGTPNIRACKFPDHLKVAIHKADNILVRPRKGVVLDDYMVGLFNSPSILSMAENDMHGQTRTRISMGQIAKWEIPVPPISVQVRYQKAIAAEERLKLSSETSLRRSEGLFGSLLQQAFSAELGG